MTVYSDNIRFKEMYPNIVRSNHHFLDTGKPLSDKEVVELLNAQHETIKQLQLDNKRLLSDYTDVCNENVALEKENEQLKKDATTLIYANQNYRKENEQFHNIANDYNIPFDKLCETFEQCLDENEQLKKENRELEKFRYSVFKNLHDIVEKEYRE